MTHDQTLAGYDIPAVEAWIAANVEALTPPLRWTRLEGGHSNLTYKIEDTAGRKAVIRRPPLGELLPGAHDMSREWRVIQALGPTAVPAPPALGFCDDASVTGAIFYVMGHVEGAPLFSAEDTERWVPEERRETLAFSFVDVLADLHALDPDEIGLGDLGKRDSYVGRQLKTWYRSWLASAAPAQYDDPRAHALHQVLTEALPPLEPPRLVHGDYGPHNCLVGPDGKISAVLDWEISTLGDPLADLAYALNPWPDPSDPIPPPPTAATAPAGFPGRVRMAQRYAERTGRSLERLDYYVAFAHWKTACILHGVYARYCEGKKSSEGVAMDELRGRIGQALDRSEHALERFRARAA